MSEPLLAVTDLTVAFPTEQGPLTAVYSVSYQVSPGEVLGIVGESGSGKSVSSMAVMGLLPPHATITGSVRFQVGILVTTLTLVLVSCGGDAAAVGGTAKIGTSDIGAMPAQALRDGGTFRWALDLLPVNFNDNQLNGPDLNNAHVIGAVLPRFWLAQPDGTVRMNGDYLVSATLRSTNPEVVTYTLRNEATWSNGTPITWQDFRAQWQALNGRNKAFQIASGTGYKDIASVERGASDKEAVVTFATPFFAPSPAWRSSTRWRTTKPTTWRSAPTSTPSPGHRAPPE